jgi:hypothetical protein
MTLSSLTNILAGQQANLASMQVFDAMALSVQQQSHIKTIAALLLHNCQLSLDIASTDTQIKVNDIVLANISRTETSTIITFTERLLIAAFSDGNAVTFTSGSNQVAVNSINAFTLLVA